MLFSNLNVFLSIVKFAGLILGTYVIIVLFFFFFQEWFIFSPQPSPGDISRSMDEKEVEAISVTTPDHVTLRGWYITDPEKQQSPLIIYFGGNAEEVSHMKNDAHKFDGFSLALMNYRGYGSSEGSPSEEHLYNDALTIYDYFAKREDVDQHSIVLMGRSLGSGVATYLAKHRQVAGLILVTPYDSIKRVAQNSFPFLPVPLILRHPFDAASLAPSIDAPMLSLTAEKDRIIPPGHAKALSDKWSGENSLVVIDGKGHNDICGSETYWKEIRAFLEKI